MRNLFQKSSPSPHLPRNVFDLSQNQVFSAKCGQLLPVYIDEVNPNESFKISTSSFLRTMPLNTASYARFNQRVDFFFVPFRLICNRFFTTLFGTQFSTTSHASNTPTDFTQLRIPYDRLVNSLTNFKNASSQDVFGGSMFDNAAKLLDLLGYGNFFYLKYGTIADSLKQDLIKYSPAFLPFRLCAYQKVYEDYFRQTDYEASSNAWNLDKYFDSTGNPFLGPAVFEPLLVMRYANCNRDYFSATHPSFQGATFLVNPVQFPSDRGLYGPSSMQVDDFYPPTTVHSTVRTGVTSQSQSSISQYSFNVESKNMMGFAGAYNNNDANIAAASIRVAFALDKLYRSTIEAADGSYSSQVKAHFGFSMKHDPYRSIYIGGSSSPIQINEVLTTANTDGGTTGDIYGRGLSLNNSSVLNFTANEHGFIIGIFSVVPTNLYPSVGVDYMNTAFNRTQWFQPEFDSIGYQPIAGFELNGISPNTQEVTNKWLQKCPYVLGFTPRYAQYKTKVDKVHFPFYSFQLNGMSDDKTNVVKGSLSPWSLPRFNSVVDTFSSNAFLSRKVKPSVIDPISSVADDGSINTDFLLCNLDINCKALRNMSVDGQPNL